MIIMGLFDFLFGKERKESSEKFKSQTIVGENEQSNKVKEKVECKDLSLIKPFVFESNIHQRYENGEPKMGLQKCLRTIRVEKNIDGCSGYKLDPGVGYIVKIYNGDLNEPNMSDKPMKIVSKNDNQIVMRGFPIEAQSPFGWQLIDYSTYGLVAYLKNDMIIKCRLHMYDRNTYIDYWYDTNISAKDKNITHAMTICETFASEACRAAESGDVSMSHKLGLNVLHSIVNQPDQITNIKRVDNVALALGKMMEGNYFTQNDDIIRAVGISYYFLCEAIEKNQNRNPYLYVYRFSLIWEYNKAFYHLFAHSEGKEYYPNDFFGNISTMTYNHHMEGMWMADGLIEPKIRILDHAIGNIFNEIYARYNATPSEQIISLGNSYHNQIHCYLKSKIINKDFDF